MNVIVVVISFQVQYGIIIENFVVTFFYYNFNYENNDIIIDLQDNINGVLMQSISLRQSCLSMKKTEY